MAGMTPAELEKIAKKILKLVQINGGNLRCNYRTMTVQEWNSWRREQDWNLDQWIGFTLSQDWPCLGRLCEVLLERMSLKQWQSKRRLSTIYNSFDNDAKTKMDSIYNFLDGDDQVVVEDRDIAKTYSDLLEAWLKATKYMTTKENLALDVVRAQRDFFERSGEMEDIPIMVLTNQMDLEVGKTLCQEATNALETWLVKVNRYYRKVPNESRAQELGFVMLRGSMVKVGSDLNYLAIVKEVKNDYAAGEVRTDVVLNSYSDEDVTVRSVGLIYNQNRLNLDVLKQIYQFNKPAWNKENGGRIGNPTDNNDGRKIRAFERRFIDLVGELGGNKIQAIVQTGSVESMEKEIDQLAKKYEILADKLEDTTEIDYITVEDQEYNVPTVIRRWRTGLLNRKQELLKEERLREKKDKMLNDDMKTLSSKENITIKLRGPSNFLAWMENITSITQKLPESTSDLKILSIIKKQHWEQI